MSLESAKHPKHINGGWSHSLLALTFSALGVVYGDIGTSPLYVMSGIFPDPAFYNTQDTIGAISTIIWALTLVPLIQYVFIVMWAGDENGEGGPFVLYALLSKYAGLNPKDLAGEADVSLSNYETIHVTDKDLDSKCSSGSSATPYSTKRLLRRLFLFRGKPGPQENRGRILQRSPALQWTLLVIALAGASLTISDGLLTPAVSIISAVNGLTVATPHAQKAVIPVSCVIVFMFFFAQRYGTAKISAFFAPVIFVWLVLLLVTGIINTTQYPGVFRAFNPAESVRWFLRTKDYRPLSGVLLALTGVEAMFADLGHFNRPSIQLSCAFIVYPSIVFAYLGQGARLVLDPLTVGTNPFYQSIPGGPSKPTCWVIWLFGILATVIASQSIVTAVFSLIHQAIQLHCFPALRIYHTSSRLYGQIYIPIANWVMMVTVILLCVFFGTSVNLTNAFGFAVATVLIVTTVLLSFVIHVIWGFPLIIALAYFLFYGFIDGLFWSATFEKVPHGAWFPLAIGVVLTMFMTFWKYWTLKRVAVELEGRVRLAKLFTQEDEDDDEKNLLRLRATSTIVIEEPGTSSAIKEAVDMEKVASDDDAHLSVLRNRAPVSSLKLARRKEISISRHPGVAFFYNSTGGGVPLTFQRFVTQFPVLPRIVVFIRIRILPISRVLEDERIVASLIPAIPGFYQATLHFGYMDNISLKDDNASKLLLKIRSQERDPALQAEIDAVLAQTPDSDSIDSIGVRASGVTHVLQNLEVCADERKISSTQGIRKAMINFYSFIHSNVREHSAYELPTDGLVVVGVRAPI